MLRISMEEKTRRIDYLASLKVVRNCLGSASTTRSKDWEISLTGEDETSSVVAAIKSHTKFYKKTLALSIYIPTPHTIKSLWWEENKS